MKTYENLQELPNSGHLGVDLASSGDLRGLRDALADALDPHALGVDRRTARARAAPRPFRAHALRVRPRGRRPAAGDLAPGLWPLRRGPGRVHALRGRSAQRES